MATQNRDVTLGVGIKTTGEENLTKLAREVENLAKRGGDAAPVYERLGEELRQLAQQAGSVTALKRVGDESEALAAAALEAAASVEKLREKHEGLKASSEQAAQAQRNARQELREAKSASDAARGALEKYTAESTKATRKTEEYEKGLVQLKSALAAAKAAQREKTDAYEQAATAATKASAAESSAATALQRAAKASEAAAAESRKSALAMADAAEAAKRLGGDVSNLAAAEQRLIDAQQAAQSGAQQRLIELRREQSQADREAVIVSQTLAEQFRRGSQALAQEEAALRDAAAATQRYEQAKRQAAAAADAEFAATVKRLQAEEQAQRLAVANDQQFAQRVRQLRAIAQAQQEATASAKAAAAADNEFATTVKRLREESLQAGEALRSAFGQTGVRSLQAIDAEAVKVRGSVSQLQAEFKRGAISAEDLARATGSAQVRLAALQREAATLPALPGVFERTSASIQGVITRFGALGAAIATVGVAARPIAETVLQLDQLRRTLNTVVGGAKETEKALEFVRQVAARSGQGFGALAEQYGKFIASAKASGIDMQVVNAAFERVAMAAGNLGLSSESTGRALNALSQIASKGVVQMEELRGQLGDALPGAMSLMAKGLGLTDQQLIKLVESGQLLARDALPALANALVELGPQGEKPVEGIRAAWNRLTNGIQEATAIVADGGFGKATGAVLEAVAFAVNRVVFGVAMIGESFTTSGQTIAAVAASMTGNLDDLGAEIDRIERESGERLGRLADRLTGTGEAAAGAALQTSAAWVQVQAQYTELIATAEKDSVVSRKAAEAKKVQVEAAKAAASASELEGEARTKAATRAAGAEAAYAKALEEVAVAEAKEAQLLRQRLTEQEKLAVENKRNDEATTKLLATLRQSVDAKQADADRSKQQALQAKAAADAADLHSRALVDNSKNLAQFRRDLEAGNGALRTAERLYAQGKISAEQLATAEANVARAATLVRDAVNDANRAQETAIRLSRAKAELAIAELETKKAEAEAAEKVAIALGNETGAEIERIKQKELSAQIAKAKAAATREETEATIELLKAQRDEVTGSDDISRAKRAEIELRILNAQKAREEAKASEAVAKGLDAEASAALRKSAAGTSNGGPTTSTGGSDPRQNTRATSPQGKSPQSEQERRSQLGGIGGGNGLGPATDGDFKTYSTDLDDGNYRDSSGRTLDQARNVRNQGGAIDSSFPFLVMQRLARGESFGADELPALQNAYRAAVQNASMGQPGSVSLEGRRQDEAIAAALRRAMESAQYAAAGANDSTSLWGMARERAGGPRPGFGGAGTVVNINLGGRQHTVRVASNADAQALEALLRQLYEAQGRTGP